LLKLLQISKAGKEGLAKQDNKLIIINRDDDDFRLWIDDFRFCD